MNEDKNTTFDLKETDYDDDDYKGDIKSKDYEEEKAQKVETIQSSSSPSAPSPDSFGKVKTYFQKCLAKLLFYEQCSTKIHQSCADLEQTITNFQQSSAKFQQISTNFQRSSAKFSARLRPLVFSKT